MKDLDGIYQPDILTASFQPDEQLLRDIREELETGTFDFHEGYEENQGNAAAVEKYLDEEVTSNSGILGEAYQYGGRIMNVIVQRTYERNGKRLPQIRREHFSLNRQIDLELAARLDTDQTILDGRMIEWKVMQQEMPAFGKAPIVPDESTHLGRQVCAGFVDIANLYDIAAKKPVRTFPTSK